MHSNLENASTQVLLLAIGFKSLSNRAVTALELLEDDKRRNNRGSGPSAGMCSDRTG
jgi:hypothetical protein